MDGQLTGYRVTGVEGGLVHVAGEDDEAHVVPTARIFWPSVVTASDRGELAAHAQQVRDARVGWDGEETWDTIAGRGPIGAMSPAELAEVVYDTRSPVHVDAAVCAAFDDAVFFKMKRGVVYPTSAHKIERLRAKLEEEDTERRLLQRVVELLTLRLEGSSDVANDEDAEAVAQHLDVLKAVAVLGREAEGFESALTLMEALAPGPGRIDDRAFRLLVRLGEFHADENLSVRRHGLRTVFSEEVQAAAAAAADKPAAAGGRVQDLTDLLTVAVDDAETSEVDDAFAMRGDTLYVFIADVARLVTQGGAVDDEAQRRASTAYLVDGKIPMLPSILSEDAASLVEGDARASLCFAFEVGDDGRLLGFEVTEASCQVDRRLTYTEVDALLEGDGEGAADGPHPELAALCRRAAGLMDRHRQGRSSRGALMLQRSEVRMALDPSGHVNLWRTSANGPARQLVSEMMVAVCTGTASWCLDNGIPGVFRVQAAPAPPVPTVVGPVVDPAERSEILRRLRPTHFSARPGVHFTLGVTCYMQVTSPLRRYHDLLMQHQIRGFLRTGRAPMRAGHLTGHFEALDRGLSRVRKAETETRRYWTLKWLAQREDQILDAVVVRRLQRHWLVELTDAGLNTLLGLSHGQNPGQHLRLEMVEVSARQDTLDLALAEVG